MRLLVQSQATGRFLVPSMDDGTPEWVAGLREAGGGVLTDPEAALQLVEDHCEPDDVAVIVDLDRLGSSDDYMDAVDAAATLPDGNHGENLNSATGVGL